MKFSFLTYLFCRFPLEYCFKMANKYRFDGIEIWGGRPHAYAYDMNKDEIVRIIKCSEKYNLEISMYTPEILAYPYSLTSRVPQERSDTLAYLLKSEEVAISMGTQRMQITLPHPGYQTDRGEVWKNVIEIIAKLAKRAEELGLIIVVEPLSPSEGNVICNVHDLVSLFKEIKSPALKGMLDVVPAVIANEPFSEYFEVLGDNMDYIHFSNSDGKTEFHMDLENSDGVIPITDMFSVFAGENYDGWCSLELLNPYFKDPELYLAQAARIIDDICQRLCTKRNRSKA